MLLHAEVKRDQRRIGCLMMADFIVFFVEFPEAEKQREEDGTNRQQGAQLSGSKEACVLLTADGRTTGNHIIAALSVSSLGLLLLRHVPGKAYRVKLGRATHHFRFSCRGHSDSSL